VRGGAKPKIDDLREKEEQVKRTTRLDWRGKRPSGRSLGYIDSKTLGQGGAQTQMEEKNGGVAGLEAWDSLLQSIGLVKS